MTADKGLAVAVSNPGWRSSLEEALARYGPLSLADLRRAYIDCLLVRCGGNRTLVADTLGVSRRTLYRWLAAANLQTSANLKSGDGQ